MSLLRALRAYMGLGPDEDYENGYLDGYGDAVDIDRPDRNRATTREFAQSGAVTTGRRSPGSTTPQSRGAPHGAVTNRSKTSPQVRSSSGDDGRQKAVESDTRQEVDLRSEPGVRSSHSPSTRSRVDIPDGRESDGPPNVEPVVGESEGEEPATTEQGAVVRSIDSVRTRPKTVSPESFADAKTVGDDFKLGTPIVLNLQGLDRDLARRLIDFASGVCYALDGSMEKLAAQVFLLTPEGIEVSESDRLRIEKRGYAR